MKKDARQTSRKKFVAISVLLVVLAVIGLVGLGLYKYNLDKQQAEKAVQEKKQEQEPSCKKYVDGVYQDEEMRSILLSQLGIHEKNIQGLVLRSVDSVIRRGPEDLVDPSGLYRGDGMGIMNFCVTSPPEIKIENKLVGVEKVVVVAHEFVHHYYSRPWFVGVVPENDLIVLYAQSAWMQERTKDYAHDGSLKLTEVLAFACTELPDRELSESIIRACNTILPKRYILGL